MWTIAFFIIVGLAWLGVGMRFSFIAMDASFDGNKRRLWKFTAATVLWFVLPISFVIHAGMEHEASLPLCLRGHEEYVRVQRLVPVGKVWTTTTRTERQWVCEQRETVR